jgi:hypothetical protein
VRELSLDADLDRIVKVKGGKKCTIRFFFWRSNIIGPEHGIPSQFPATTSPSVSSVQFTLNSTAVKYLVGDPAFEEFVALEHRIALLVQFIHPERALDIIKFLLLLLHSSPNQPDSQDGTRRANISSLKDQIDRRSNSSGSKEIPTLDIPPVSFNVYADLLWASFADPWTQTTHQDPPQEFDRSLKARIEMRLNLQILQNLLQFFTLSSSKVDLGNTLAVSAMRKVRSFVCTLALLSTSTEPGQYGCRISMEDSRVQSKQPIYL